MCRGQPKRIAIAVGEESGLAILAAVPHRSDGMYDMVGGKPVAVGPLRFTRLAAAQQSTFRNEVRSGRPMDCPVDATAAEQRGVRRVDDGIHGQRRDIGLQGPSRCRTAHRNTIRWRSGHR